MIKLYKQFFIILLLSIALVSIALPVFALELKYPNLPMMPGLTDASTLPDYISYFFSFSIFVAGAIAVVSLAIGGIQYVASMGNPGMITNAKDRIFGSLLGIILLTASVIILRAINPHLATPTLEPLPYVDGIYYTNGTDLKPAPMEETNVRNVDPRYRKIKYVCRGENGRCPVGEKCSTLLIWKYPQPNFQEPTPNTATTWPVSCGQEAAISDANSFKMDYERPGIYLFRDAGCIERGYRSYAVTSGGNIEDEFVDNIRSVKIINDGDNGAYFGAIFHQQTDYYGKCSKPIINYEEEEECKPFNLPEVSSVTVFNWNENFASSGDGISFYSLPYGWKAGELSGYNTEIGWEDNINPILEVYSDRIPFSYTGVGVPFEENCQLNPDCPCPNFYECPGSMQVKGDYLIALYSESEDDCQIFYKDINNFKSEVDITAQGNKLGTINIIPVK